MCKKTRILVGEDKSGKKHAEVISARKKARRARDKMRLDHQPAETVTVKNGQPIPPKIARLL